MEKEKLVKIFFEINNDNLFQNSGENLWAKEISKNNYQIDNIPFFVYGINYQDIIFAEHSEKTSLITFKNVIKYSGNSTVRVISFKEENIKGIRKNLKELGCDNELDVSNIISVNIPKEVDFKIVKKYLDSIEDFGIGEYEEASIF